MKHCIALLAILFTLNGVAQNLNVSRTSSYYTYIFSISDKEARYLFRNGFGEANESFFHTILDSFPSDSSFNKKLPLGHYLKVHSEKHELKIFYTSVQPFQAVILENNTDLVVQVIDTNGIILPNAKVRIGAKNLRYDKKTKAYIDRNSNRKGVLSIEHNQQIAFYPLTRKINNSAVKRNFRLVAYNPPIKYVWMPVRFVVYLPYDGAKSIVHGYPQGTIRRSWDFFKRSYYQLACLFDNWYCDFYFYGKKDKSHKGYFVFNKPKYQPADSVRFKAYIVNHKGRALNRAVEVYLNKDGSYLKLGEISPQMKGSYDFSFYLHDTLNLRLDKVYSIYLDKSRHGKTYSTGSFRYEDYELSKVQLSIRTEKPRHYQGDSLKLYIKGTDENDLILPDARIEIVIRPSLIQQVLTPTAFIPDTLRYIEMRLDTEEETEVILTDCSFPKANFKYEIAVNLVTTDFEKVSAKETIEYYHELKEISSILIKDTLLIDYRVNGVSHDMIAKIFALDAFNNKIFIEKVPLPHSVVISPHFSAYRIKGDGITKTISMKDESSLLKCFSERDADSIRFQIDNPRNIPFSYFIYRKNQEKGRGHARSLDIKKRTGNYETFFISLHYLWAGRMVNETYRIPFHDKKLNISVTEPLIIYPGQTTTIEVQVSDQKGRPVPGVDLTAYSLTQKFNYDPPQLPYLGKTRKDKSLINSFSFDNSKTNSEFSRILDFNKWNSISRVDSIEYYRFIYPKNNIYKHEYPSPDSITQFSPFVMCMGQMEPVHVIYVDNRPVYFSWSENIQKYSFHVNPGFHQIKLRTLNHIYTIDSVYFTGGNKLIVSINDSIDHPGVKIEKTKPVLSNHEKNILQKYIFPYRYTFGDRFPYLEQNSVYHLLRTDNTWRSSVLAGPIYPGNLSFRLPNEYTTRFIHEPFFEYEFSQALLKMRSVDQKLRYPSSLRMYKSGTSISDLVHTQESILQEYQNRLDLFRRGAPRYDFPRSTKKGNGRLLFEIELDVTASGIPLNTLLFKYDDNKFIRVHPGFNNIFEDLPKGHYRLFLFFPDNFYFVQDSLYVTANGLNFYKLGSPETFQRDSFSIYLNQTIEKTIYGRWPAMETQQRELTEIIGLYTREYVFSGEGDIITGFVTSAEDYLGIPGASVIVKGTNIGTVTDFNGYYSLKVPRNFNTLVFSFVGYQPEEIEIGSRNTISPVMSPDILAMEEVVIVGYGVQRQMTVASSVTSISSPDLSGLESVLSQNLKGRVSGISINYDPEKEGVVAGITIRGVASHTFTGQPMVIIDGMVFTGDMRNLEPSLIRNIQVLQGASATALYGSRAANGVIILSTGGEFITTASKGEKEEEPILMEAVSQEGSIRSNFSDHAFWQPSLVTNSKGIARFEVTFPDDVTNWKTFYLAMNNRRQTGQTESSIKSYKPLMAQLALPRFMVRGDTANIIGKSTNYAPDSVTVRTVFEIDDRKIMDEKRRFYRSIIDTFEITTTENDSLLLQYYLTTSEGYMDGEKRHIQVFPAGMETVKGEFHLFETDTIVSLEFDKVLGEVYLHAESNALNILEKDIQYLVNFRYECNEQLASKIKALLAEKIVNQLKGESFKNERLLTRTIRKLESNQVRNGLWGWWRNSPENIWISLHVLEALSIAKNQGYSVSINEKEVAEYLVWNIEKTKNISDKIRMLKIFYQLKVSTDYDRYFEAIEQEKELKLNQRLLLYELKQLTGRDFNPENILQYQRESMLGSIYFSDNDKKRSIYDNDIQNTIIAYRILRNDTLNRYNRNLSKIRNYFFENRGSLSWMNTFETAMVLETLLPDIISEEKELELSSLILSGPVNDTVTVFPYSIRYQPDIEKLQVQKKGQTPLFFTGYQKYWDSNPEEKISDFIIDTRFENDSNNSILQAGKEIKLIINVQVLKDAEYVVIHIPIPAGCSYVSKDRSRSFETHRESYRNETVIFCENLPGGHYQFEINLLPRYSGFYRLNPAKIELMYFPTFNANNESRRVYIK